MSMASRALLSNFFELHSGLKTTHKTFRDCRVHFFRQPFSKYLYTGCPKSSFLYFISLYFSTIELVKQIIGTKVVSFNLIHYFHTCCAIFWLEYSICVLPHQRCPCASIFSSHIFFVFHSPELLELLPCILWTSRKINRFNAKKFS